MTPAARVQAAIELLDRIIDAARAKGAPADRLITAYFKTRRYAGSKDRRAVRELVYRAVRHCGEVPDSGRAAMLALAETDPALFELFDGSAHGPAQRVSGEPVAEAGLAPDWLIEALAASGIEGEAALALLDRAPLDIRVNALKASRETLDLPEVGEPLIAPHALRFATGTKVEPWHAFRDGIIEVQDHASQLICEAVPANPGDTVLDLCAGAGGKTLALAARFGNALSLIASDTDKRRLGNLAPRAARAGAAIDHTVLLDPGRELEALSAFKGSVDHVLVDAPCSGSGTWRRNPESRWRLDRAELARLNALQDHVLDVAAALVRSGGSVTYVTCSLLDAEGPDRMSAFLDRCPRFSPDDAKLPLGTPRGTGTRLDPFHHGTDGFFIAIARCA
ncbi:MAG: RsmB/NOP family class I SAM-dependent RNA methyltransferase [Erythrobacter sp.]|uniref:RsmB/NOP family class I SAM-dependent RNA methyltransferase n=1 Tax=Erythrobacter sp. TaxID=1042 RepID=UPI0026358111|nr:RsmB/NOP family class I SAM-dependent RNA methyltransferase [Erythrobacter sp.]MDJ0977894.1 RsmB/NOP family class I SAM-dependent RNA methyltransferase [Erythrobacter sp.]